MSKAGLSHHALIAGMHTWIKNVSVPSCFRVLVLSSWRGWHDLQVSHSPTAAGQALQAAAQDALVLAMFSACASCLRCCSA